MSQTKTFTCDQCRKAVVSSELPFDWRQVSLAARAVSYNWVPYDMCSPACAANWVESRFRRDLNCGRTL